jgi:hypothetical protein
MGIKIAQTELLADHETQVFDGKIAEWDTPQPMGIRDE